MASYASGPNLATAVYKNVWKRSTENIRFETHVCAADTVPSVTLADGTVAKVLQPGTIMAKITSGADAGMVGPYNATLAGAFEVATITNGASGGTFTITVDDGSGPQTTADIAFDATNAAVLAALEALSNVEPGDFTVASGPNYVITWQQGGNQIDLTVEDANATGGTITVAITTQGSDEPSIADGRELAANIVGVNDTYLPVQLNRRDVEVAIAYANCVGIQEWCIEYGAANAPGPLTNTTRDAIQARADLDIIFRPVHPDLV